MTTKAFGLSIVLAILSAVGIPGAQERTAPPVPALNGTPIFRVDPSWPTTPADWTWGQVIGIFADARGHVWTSSRSRISEWDPQGKLLQSWDARGPNGNWSTIHGLFVDHHGFVWTNARESHLTVKFTRTGQVAMVIGKYNETGGSNDPTLMGRPSEIWVDPADNEVFVADGYGNRRIVVFDKYGKFLRQWGRQATPEEMEAGVGGAFAEVVHSVAISNAGLVYVGDRQGDRIQVFDKMGNFKRNIWIRTGTPTLPDKRGTAWWTAFSPDQEQKYLYVMNGRNEQVHVLDHASGTILSSFGRPGHQLGHFTHGHSLAVDSKGNLYIAETNWGRRVHRFNLVK
jgi:DNA-binding beta-propeller fold protein YncE